MKTISQLSRKIMESKDQPHILSDLLLEMATKFAVVSDTYKDLRLSKNQYWQSEKFKDEKHLSDKAVEIAWHCTEDGTKELRANIELKSLEKLMSAVKTYLRTIETESRNQF